MTKCIPCVHSHSDDRGIDNSDCPPLLFSTRNRFRSFILFAANACLTLFAGNLSAQQPATTPVLPAGVGVIPATSTTSQIDSSNISSTAYVSVSSNDDLPDNPAPQNPNPTRKPQTKRILGIVPNFRAVGTDERLPPQTPKEKFLTTTQDSFDYSSTVIPIVLAGL